MINSKLLLILVVTVLTGSNLMAAGNASAGKMSYAMCGACHGANGEGNRAMNAPRLAGQDEWYLVSTLKRFKSGARGSSDPVAASMVPMAKMLTDVQIENVSAYIATLK